MEKQKLWVLLALMGLTAGITACSGQKGRLLQGSSVAGWQKYHIRTPYRKKGDKFHD